MWRRLYKDGEAAELVWMTPPHSSFLVQAEGFHLKWNLSCLYWVLAGSFYGLLLGVVDHRIGLISCD